MRVVGVDLSAEPLELARSAAQAAGVQVDLRRVDMREIEFRDEFDAALNLWTSFGYFETEAEDRLVLDRVLRALRPGGAFVIETINLHGVLRRFEPRAWHELGGGRLLLEERAFDPWTGRMHSGWTLVEPSGERIEMSFATRAYTLVELAGMMADAGFDVEGVGRLPGLRLPGRQPAHDRARPPPAAVNFSAHRPTNGYARSRSTDRPVRQPSSRIALAGCGSATAAGSGPGRPAARPHPP